MIYYFVTYLLGKNSCNSLIHTHARTLARTHTHIHILKMVFMMNGLRRQTPLMIKLMVNKLCLHVYLALFVLF